MSEKICDDIVNLGTARGLSSDPEMEKLMEQAMKRMGSGNIQSKLVENYFKQNKTKTGGKNINGPMSLTVHKGEGKVVYVFGEYHVKSKCINPGIDVSDYLLNLFKTTSSFID